MSNPSINRLREKIAVYERFLHDLSLYSTSMNGEAIRKLVGNADRWSYAHRCGNGELSDEEQDRIIENAFRRLLDTD